MAYREFRKNSAETVRVCATQYKGYDLIDVRIFAKTRNGEIVPTRKGVSLNVDQIHDLIECLVWSLQQPCKEGAEAEEAICLSEEEADRLARHAHSVLSRHGLAVHWDTAESMILQDPEMKCFSKWQLHYVLVTRKDLFYKEDAGCYRAR